MPPKKSKSNQATNSAAAALAACEDLMLCILARLPVKLIFQFKSVFNKNDSNTISVINIESDEKKAKMLDHPFNYTQIDIVGCCRGLVCIKRGKGFVLWNPATNLSKTVLPLKDAESDDAEGDDSESVSLGFGYDAEGDDFKVVRIGCLEYERGLYMCVSWVEVYSVNSDSWTTIDPGFEFSGVWNDNKAIVNGNPYWAVEVNENDVLICFDMSKLVFKIVLDLSTLDYNKFVELNGSLCALLFTRRNEERIAYVDAWVCLMRVSRYGQIVVDGRVLGKRPNGQLIVFNSEPKCVKGLFNVGNNFEIYDYTASLAYIHGMEKVTLRGRGGIRRN
ncbi:hypothetical protein CASFOL_011577 [Castilleja foliolosa]|uniref:F-box associated beta-propeller type 1 domain-containing protein n=1 Tax=Castilleja foliolosa TaxID=1961234 RepID=A0ABD3DXS7_9LAMI